MRKGLPSRRKFYDTILQAVRANRDQKRDQVMKALLNEVESLIHRRGYELAAPGAFEELAWALNEVFKPRHEGRLSRITRRMSYVPGHEDMDDAFARLQREHELDPNE